MDGRTDKDKADRQVRQTPNNGQTVGPGKQTACGVNIGVRLTERGRDQRKSRPRRGMMVGRTDRETGVKQTDRQTRQARAGRQKDRQGDRRNDRSKNDRQTYRNAGSPTNTHMSWESGKRSVQ